MSDLRELGEFGWIAHQNRALSVRRGVRVGIGDDAAVLETLRAPVVTSDCLVENVHFRLDWSSPRQLGRKALSVNVSDLAAMGARPVAAFVSLAIPSHLSLSFWDEFYRGMEEIAAQFEFTIAGGDTARSHGALFINITLVGEGANEGFGANEVENIGGSANANANKDFGESASENASESASANKGVRESASEDFGEGEIASAEAKTSATPVLRSGARADDVLIVTGTLGDAAAGLWILQNPRGEVSALARDQLLHRHLDPTARLREMQAALSVGGVRAALDLSDGLAGDAAHIARASEVSLQIETSKLPISEACRETARIAEMQDEVTSARKAAVSENRVLDTALQWALSGGEDYELLLCVAPEIAAETARRIETRTGTRATIIGRCVQSESAVNENRVVLLDDAGREINAPHAWTHF